MKTLIIALMIPFLFTAGLSQDAGKQEKAKTGTAVDKAMAEYTCPMHPDVKSSTPGRCPKCGMNLVAVDKSKEKMDMGGKMKSGKMMHDGQMKSSSASGKLSEALSVLKTAKSELVEAGKYRCCIETPCDRCLIDHQSCSCAIEVKEGKPVCSDCYAGWQRGDGVVKGVEKSRVKMETHDHDH